MCQVPAPLGLRRLIRPTPPKAREAGWRDPGDPAGTLFCRPAQWRGLGTESHAAGGCAPARKGKPARRRGRERRLGIRGRGKVTTLARCGKTASAARDARLTWGLSSQLAEASAPRCGAALVGRRQSVGSRNQLQGLILPTAARTPGARGERVRRHGRGPHSRASRQPRSCGLAGRPPWRAGLGGPGALAGRPAPGVCSLCSSRGRMREGPGEPGGGGHVGPGPDSPPLTPLPLSSARKRPRELHGRASPA